MRGWRLWSVSLALALIGCAAPRPPVTVPAWEGRLRGDTIVLLGEVHDSAEQHRQRLAVLRRALDAGWRPALAMEQFDRERQPDIERARRERPRDAQYLIDTAGSERAGWQWPNYRPFVALALDYDLPLLAANLSNADTARIVRQGTGAVFDAAQQQALGLDRPIAAGWQAAQEREIDQGHCGALPPKMWPAMARAQFARDAVMAETLRQHAAGGVVLLAGNGHVRRDIGVPRWLDGALGERVFAVGYVENPANTPAAFDALVVTPPQPRGDPCEGFKAAPPKSQ